jgi:hypothetical protein
MDTFGMVCYEGSDIIAFFNDRRPGPEKQVKAAKVKSLNEILHNHTLLQ